MTRGSPRIAVCDTEETLAAASRLFNDYRHHYGQTTGADDRVVGWLTEMVRSQMIVVLTASGPPPDASPIGLATAHAVPASLSLGRLWQLRDLYVSPGSRRQGVAQALVDAVRDAAQAAGATRLSLVTELDNHAALDLYRGLGFRPVDGLTTLSLDLTRPAGSSARRSAAPGPAT